MNGARILVINDDPTFARQLKVHLEGHGTRVCLATNIAEGMDLAEASPIDLIVFEGRTHDDEGVDECRRWRQSPVFQTTPMLLIWSEASHFDARTVSLDMGMQGFISRPFTDQELLVQVRMLLQLGHAHRSLRESEEKWHVIVDSTLDAIITMDEKRTHHGVESPSSVCVWMAPR